MLVRLFAPVGAWFRRRFLDDVPADIEVCEFDCRKADCPPEELLGCERRLKHSAVLEAEAARTDTRAAAEKGRIS